MRNRRHHDLNDLIREWDNADFWVVVGKKLAVWGACGVIALAAILMFSGWVRLGV